MSKTLQLAACILSILLIAACTPPAAEDTSAAPTAVLAEASAQTEQTTVASSTPAPTATTVPTDTPEATATPTRTATVTVTPTSTPTATPAPTTAPQPTPTFTAERQMKWQAGDCSPFHTCIPEPAPPSKTLEDTHNILLLGSDLRKGDRAWRTDTMLLVAVDKQNNRVGLLSIPRDFFVYIPEYNRNNRNFDRINEVDYAGEYGADVPKHKDGGFGLLKEVFAYNFGIRIDDVVRLHRQGFVDIVDALGGVNVNLECEVWEISPTEGYPGYAINGVPYYVLSLPLGPNRLDGETALKFVTYRYAQLDYQRSARQHAFLSAFKDQFVRPETLTQVPSLWRAFKDYFQTDFGLRDILGLAALAANMDSQSIHSRVFDPTMFEKPYDTPAAFVISKGNSVSQVIEGLFEGPAASTQTKPSFGCWRPKWADDYLAWAAQRGTPVPVPPAAASPVPVETTPASVPEATPETAPEATAAPEATPAPSSTTQPGA